MTTLCQLINRQVAVRPDAVYLKDAESDAQITYEQLRLSCLGIGRLLEGKGVRSGDTVSVVMPNGVNTMRLLLAGMYCGVIVNPVNLLSQPDQMSYVLAHSDCKLVVTSSDWYERVRRFWLVLIDPLMSGYSTRWRQHMRRVYLTTSLTTLR